VPACPPLRHCCSAREQARLKDAHQYVASLGFHLQVQLGSTEGVCVCA